MSGQTVGISAVAHALAGRQEDNLARATEFGFEESFITEKVGFRTLTLAENPDDATFQLSRAAIEALLEKTGRDVGDIDCLIVCTQNPDGHGLPNTASALHGEMGFAQSCAAFDISLGCSGYVYGLTVIQSFMQAAGLRCGVLVTADPYSKIIAPDDRDTSVLFGDAGTATLLEPGAPWQLGTPVFGSDGTRRAAISVGQDGQLSMNGRGVFVFTAQTVPNLVQDVLARNEMTLDDIDLLLAHQGSLYIVSELRRRLGGLDESKLPFMASETGNTVSSSLPLMLEQKMQGDAARILLIGFGVGLSWGAVPLTRT